MSPPEPILCEKNGIVRACSAQMVSVWEDPERTLSRAEQFIHHAARSGADIICFPEQFATGWDPESLHFAQGLSGPIITTLKSFAMESCIAILGSFREAASGETRNTSVLIGSDGRLLARYSKIHLFSHARENEFFHPGTGLGMFSLGSLSCGIAICYDLRFPDLFRIYAQKGVHAVFIPSAWPESRIRYWELFIRARAAENQMYIVGINTTGTTPVDRYSGTSMTADPFGTIIRKAGDAEQLLFSDLDIRVVEEARRAFPVIQDRKEETYNALSREIHSGP